MNIIQSCHRNPEKTASDFDDLVFGIQKKNNFAFVNLANSRLNVHTKKWSATTKYLH